MGEKYQFFSLAGNNRSRPLAACSCRYLRRVPGARTA